MTRYMACAALAFGLVNTPHVVMAESSSNGQPLNCDVGPVSKRFGGTEWLVYSCSDRKSVVAVSAPGNPAMPFYFFLSLRDGKYQVSGEGNGNKKATKAAFNDLSSLLPSEVASLIEQTQSVGK